MDDEKYKLGKKIDAERTNKSLTLGKFRDETNRRMLPRNMLPILSRKIVDSNLLNRMHELL